MLLGCMYIMMNTFEQMIIIYADTDIYKIKLFYSKCTTIRHFGLHRFHFHIDYYFLLANKSTLEPFTGLFLAKSVRQHVAFIFMTLFNSKITVIQTAEFTYIVLNCNHHAIKTTILCLSGNI